MYLITKQPWACRLKTSEGEKTPKTFFLIFNFEIYRFRHERNLDVLARFFSVAGFLCSAGNTSTSIHKMRLLLYYPSCQSMDTNLLRKGFSLQISCVCEVILRGLLRRSASRVCLKRLLKCLRSKIFDIKRVSTYQMSGQHCEISYSEYSRTVF